MLITFFRAIVLYLIVLVVMRLMGKREIGQLQPFELAISIMIADLASIPMTEIGIPIFNGIVPILGLLVMHLILSLINLKSLKAREIICGKPSILIYRGKINEKELKKERFTINELEERLRGNNVVNLGDVEYAILETSGQVTVIQKPEKRNTIPEDSPASVHVHSRDHARTSPDEWKRPLPRESSTCRPWCLPCPAGSARCRARVPSRLAAERGCTWPSRDSPHNRFRSPPSGRPAPRRKKSPLRAAVSSVPPTSSSSRNTCSGQWSASPAFHRNSRPLRSLRQTTPGKRDRIPSPAPSTACGTSRYIPACRRRRRCGPRETGKLRT